MSLHANSLAAYESIRLSDREAAVLALYVPGVSYTDDDLAALEGKTNSRETSPRITGLRDKGLVIETKHGATSQFLKGIWEALGDLADQCEEFSA